MCQDARWTNRVGERGRVKTSRVFRKCSSRNWRPSLFQTWRRGFFRRWIEGWHSLKEIDQGGFGEIEVHKIQQETGQCCDSPSPQRRTLWSGQRIRYLAILPTVLLPGTLFLRLRFWAGVGTTVEGWYSAALGVGVQAAVWRGVVGLKLRGPLDFLQCPHWKLKGQDDTFFNFYSKSCCLRHKGTRSQIRLFLKHTNLLAQITMTR